MFCLFGFLSSVTAAGLLPRLNYGVVFKHEANLILSCEYWLHTYEISMPHHVHFPAIGTCHRDNNTCLLVSHVLSQVNSIRLETNVRLYNTLTTVTKLVPHANSVKNAKESKCTLLSFIGKFSKTLFGTATTDDVNVLATHINAHKQGNPKPC